MNTPEDTPLPPSADTNVETPQNNRPKCTPRYIADKIELIAGYRVGPVGRTLMVKWLNEERLICKHVHPPPKPGVKFPHKLPLNEILKPDLVQKKLKSFGQMLQQPKSALFMDIDD